MTLRNRKSINRIFCVLLSVMLLTACFGSSFLNSFISVTAVDETVTEPESVEDAEDIEDPVDYSVKLSAKCDGIRFYVYAEKGTFPRSARLSVKPVSDDVRSIVEDAVSAERVDGANVAVSYTYDITVTDKKGVELQPADGKLVQVWFELPEAANENLDASVYHIKENKEEKTAEAAAPEAVLSGGDITVASLPAQTSDDAVVVNTDGFSIYTVEFTYGDMQYVLDGGEEIPLSVITEYLGIVGDVTDAISSNSEYFHAYPTEDGVWMVESLQPFSSNETLRITVDGVDYEIVVTDDVIYHGNGDSYEADNVIQGDNGLTFAAGAPLTTIRLNYDILADPKNSYYTKITDDPGFVTLPASELYVSDSTKGSASDLGGTFCAYDSSLPGSQIISINRDNFWSGDLFKFTFPDSAYLPDGSLADVELTFSNLHIVLQSNFTGDYKCQTYIASGSLLRAGNSYGNSWRDGIQVDINIKVVDKFGNTVDGTFMYPMTDIDVSRDGNANFARLFGAEDNRNYSEMIAVNSGNIGNIYIPDPAGVDEASVSPNYGAISPSNRGYKTGVENYGDGTRFFGLGKSDADPGTYYSGFITVADNTSGGLNITAWTSGSKSAVIRTNFLNGQQIINHTIVSSTTAGGNIQTTGQGNVDSMLNDGSEIRGPGTYVVPEGKDQVYTMIPATGFAIDELMIGDELDGSKNQTTITNEQLVALKKGEIDHIDVIMNTDIIETMIIANNPIQYQVGERTGVLTYDPDRDAYIYKFPINNYHHKIHVSWKPITNDLRITKTALQDAGDMEFPFTLVLNESDDYPLPDQLTMIKSDGTIATVPVSAAIPFTLKGGQTVTFVGVPLEAGYVVTEGTLPPEWSLKTATGDTGTIGVDPSYYSVRYDQATSAQQAAFVWSKDNVRYNAGGTIPLNASTVSNGNNITYASASITERIDPTLAWEATDGVVYYYDNSITPVDAVAEAPCKEAAFVNEKASDITVTKTVQGGTVEREFSFEITIADLAGQEIEYVINDETYTMTLDSAGKGAFTLANGQSITFKSIPRGSVYEIRETSYEGYIPTVSVLGEVYESNSTGLLMLEENAEIGFTNTTLEILPETGGFGGFTPLIMLAATAFCVSFVFYIYRLYIEKRVSVSDGGTQRSAKRRVRKE